MRIKIHHEIGKNVCSELKNIGCNINEKLFLFGNIFPDLIHSYIWCRHEYQHSREYVRKKLDKLKRRPMFFSFHLGILAHYICDYFCYPHSASFDKGLIEHIIYEIQQKIPSKSNMIKLELRTFTIEELDRLVKWYDNSRPSINDDEWDFLISSVVTSSFIQNAY